MNIAFALQRGDQAADVHKIGDVLTIDGEVFDFSSLPDGATLPSLALNSSRILGDVEHVDGHVTLTLFAPFQFGAVLVQPAPLLDPPDGALAIPFLTAEEPGDE